MYLRIVFQLTSDLLKFENVMSQMVNISFKHKKGIIKTHKYEIATSKAIIETK